MDARLTRAEAAYLLPLPVSPALERARALRLEAAAAYQAGLTEGARQLLARLGDALFGWAARARARAELGALTDRELADIGLSRGEIERAVAVAKPAPAATSRPTRRPASVPMPRPA
ncbi:DUF1127 domain-containing protein [Paracraurococcus ruber]|uniref:YjiS-like domain-containing protein n=1 Tax=Paracraurococcus ruber TaxID=77675 RepID=A0ABS1CV80_9PROT|nr:DUF1127 domain-containing protein [Paracraurococcus ruber]MBK1658418.1 hypothetical protein [Paracraurococcus ruber]TDG32674.1 DUF1127 domain-containing protein [Paracraurococcus ruber]